MRIVKKYYDPYDTTLDDHVLIIAIVSLFALFVCLYIGKIGLGIIIGIICLAYIFFIQHLDINNKKIQWKK